MKGQWKTFSQVLEGKRKYIAGRQIDMNETLHAGNFEYRGDYTTDREAVMNLCNQLNQCCNEGTGGAA